MGDSLGMVLQGHSTTLPVSIDEMLYHTASVARGNRTAWLIADMPFGSYQESAELAVHNAVRLMAYQRVGRTRFSSAMRWRDCNRG